MLPLCYDLRTMAMHLCELQKQAAALKTKKAIAEMEAEEAEAELNIAQEKANLAELKAEEASSCRSRSDRGKATPDWQSRQA